MYRKSASIGATQSAMKRDALEPLPLESRHALLRNVL